MQDEVQLLKEGRAEFEIDMISDRDSQGNYHTSKSGNRLIKARFHVVDSVGDIGTIWVNIIHQHLYRLRDICESVGMPNVYKEYKQGRKVLEELIGQEGHCELVVKRDEQYGDKMDIKSFIPKKNKVEKIVEKIIGDEKVPF